MRWYGYLALCSLVICQYLMFRKAEPFYTFFTPIQWWNYIFFADAIVSARQRQSLITDRPFEFIMMLIFSNIFWLTCELYNFLLHNWYYVNLSHELWQRLIGYSFSFATIFPGIFISADLLESFGLFKNANTKTRKLTHGFLIGSFIGGVACLVFPLVLPSPYVFGFVWLGYFFLLEPVNYRMGNSSIYQDFEEGKWQRFWLLIAGGAICGLLWEFWNYWARAKWIYTVPFTRNVHYFEMPLLGFIGFPPFALECFAAYHFLRGLLTTKTPGH